MPSYLMRLKTQYDQIHSLYRISQWVNILYKSSLKVTSTLLYNIFNPLTPTRSKSKTLLGKKKNPLNFSSDKAVTRTQGKTMRNIGKKENWPD